MDPLPVAHGRVQTPRAARYLVQVCRHLAELQHQPGDARPPHHWSGRHAGGHGPTDAGVPDVVSVDWNDHSGSVQLGSAHATLTADDDGLSLVVQADDEPSLESLQRRLTETLARIGRRDGLAVGWQDRR